MNNLSIKTITLTSCLSGILLVSVVALMITNEIITHWLTNSFDDNMLAKINLMQTLTEVDEEGLEFEFADEYMLEYSRETAPEYFQIWVDQGETFERSRSLKNDNLTFQEFALNQHQFENILLPDGRNGRIVSVSFYPKLDDDLVNGDEDKPHLADLTIPLNNISDVIADADQEAHFLMEAPLVTISIARERSSLDNTITYANLVLFAAFLTLLILLAVIVWWSINRGLKPLKELQLKIGQLNFKTRDVQIHLTKTPQELMLLVDTFNTMLASIREGFEREQQFSSDVAHELKTPIAEIRTLSEVSLIGQDEEQELAVSMRDILNVSIKMGDLVNKLLAHARSQQEHYPLKLQLLNVAEVIENFINNSQTKINQRLLQVDINISGNPIINTSTIEFTQIVNNLIGNAIQYSQAENTIHIHWQNRETDFEFRIVNINHELCVEDLPNMFKRLWKKDIARSNMQHFGIGLSLVKAYCDALKYRIDTKIVNDLFTICITGNSQNNDSEQTELVR